MYVHMFLWLNFALLNDMWRTTSSRSVILKQSHKATEWQATCNVTLFHSSFSQLVTISLQWCRYADFYYFYFYLKMSSESSKCALFHYLLLWNVYGRVTRTLKQNICETWKKSEFLALRKPERKQDGLYLFASF